MPIQLDPVQGGYNLSVINDNFQRIEDTWDEKLDRLVSAQGNHMEQDLDMNGYTILNANVDSNIYQGAIEAIEAQEVESINNVRSAENTAISNIVTTGAEIENGLQDSVDDALGNAIITLPTLIPLHTYGSGTLVLNPVNAGEFAPNQGVVRVADQTEAIYRFAGGAELLPYDMSQPFDPAVWVDANVIRRRLLFSTSLTGARNITITPGQHTFGPFYENGTTVSVSQADCYLNGKAVSPSNVSLTADRLGVTISLDLEPEDELDISINSIVSKSEFDNPEPLVFNVADYGELGTADGTDHIAFNRCMDAVRTYIQSTGTALSATNNGLLIKLDRDIKCSQPLDFTGIRAGWSVVFDGQGSTIHTTVSGGTGVDCLGSRRLTMKNFTVWADEADGVRRGMQIGRAKTGQVADENHYDNIHILGSYVQAAMFNMASELSLHTHCTYLNDNTYINNDSYALMCDSFNYYNTTSAYIDTSDLLPKVGNSNNNNTYIQCKFTRRISGQSNGYAIHLDNNMHGHRFLGCYMIASGDGGIHFYYQDDVHTKAPLNIEFVGHLEKNPDSDYLGYFMTIESASLNVNEVDFLGLKIVEHNLFPNQAVILGKGFNRINLYADVDIPETTTNDGTTGKYATFLNPSSMFQYTGDAKLTSKLNPVVFDHAANVDLRIVGDTYYNGHSARTYFDRAPAGTTMRCQTSDGQHLEQLALDNYQSVNTPINCLGRDASGFVRVRDA